MRHLKSRRPRALVAVVLVIIVAISLHVTGGVLLLQTGLGAFSAHSPLTYVLLGALVVLAIVKLKHVRDFLRRKHHRRYECSPHE